MSDVLAAAAPSGPASATASAAPTSPIAAAPKMAPAESTPSEAPIPVPDASPAPAPAVLAPPGLPATPSTPTAASAAALPTTSPAATALHPPLSASAAAAAATSTTTTSASTPTPPQRERHSLTLDQRRELRRWANGQLSRPSHRQCIEWFQSVYGMTISQSTVSHSLSAKYARLDGEPQLSGSRLRFGNWPEVEKLVLHWYQQMAASGHQPTNDELADKAKAVFTQLPRHRGEEAPEFSPGWIHRFKKRYSLLARRQRPPSSSVARPAIAAGEHNSGVDAVPDAVVDAAAATTTAMDGVVVEDVANDVAYLVDALPRYMSDITADTSPFAIRESVMRYLGVEPGLDVCTRVRDELVRLDPALAGHTGILSSSSPPLPPPPSHAPSSASASAAPAATSSDLSTSQLQPLDGGQALNGNDSHRVSASAVDPGAKLQRALQQELEQYAAAAEAATAAATPVEAVAAAAAAAPSTAAAADAMASETAAVVPGGPVRPATPADASSSSSASSDQPQRCPVCVSPRVLCSVKEAVEHMSAHVDVTSLP